MTTWTKQLRAINPIPSSTSPTDADKDRRAALLEEILKMTQTTTNPNSIDQRGRNAMQGSSPPAWQQRWSESLS